METAPEEIDPTLRKQVVRRRALGNLMVVLLDQADRAEGRLRVRPFRQGAVQLDFRDVRTLVRHGQTMQIAVRDFTVVLACPPLWPFDRAAPLIPFVVSPDDFVHPNSDGRGICLDLAGVLPELVPGILYDSLRVCHFRLDHCVDHNAAAFVRQHLDQFPADERPLCRTETDR